MSIVNKRLRVEPLREATPDDFAPVGDINSAGCALAFITLIADDTPWDFQKDGTLCKVTLKISYREAPQIKKQLDEWEAKGLYIPNLFTLSYLSDLWRAQLVTFSTKISKGNVNMAMEKLKAVAKIEEPKLYKLAVDKFNEAVKTLQISGLV